MKIVKNGLINENGIALPLVLVLVVIMTFFHNSNEYCPG